MSARPDTAGSPIGRRRRHSDADLAKHYPQVIFHGCDGNKLSNMGKWALDFRRRYVCSGSCSVGSFVTVLELALAKLRMCRVDITNDGEECASEGHWSRDWLGGFMWVQCEDDISNEIAACCYFSEELMWFWGTIAEYAAVGHFTAEDAGVDMKKVGILIKQGLLVDTEANLLHALKTVNADREQRMQGVRATRRIANADKQNTEVVAACDPSGDGRKASIPAESNGRKSSSGVVVKKEDTSDSDSSTSDGGMNEEKPGASVVKKEDTSGSYSSSGDAPVGNTSRIKPTFILTTWNQTIILHSEPSMVLHSEPSVNGFRNHTNECSWIPDECACMVLLKLTGGLSNAREDANVNGDDESTGVSSGDEDECAVMPQVKSARI